MKFAGKIGIWLEDEEVSPGVWKPKIIEKPCTGDILRYNRRWQDPNTQNEVFTVNNQISILADLELYNNYASIKYVLWKGTKWRISSITDEYPRLIIELGGEYNENKKTPTS